MRRPRRRPPFSVPGTPHLPPGLLDNGVHGCNALGHDERLTVGDVVQGRSRVARQNDLQRTPGLLRDLGRRRAPTRLCSPARPGPQLGADHWPALTVRQPAAEPALRSG